MDNYDHNGQPLQQSPAPNGSPFSDSPYVNQWQHAANHTYQQPVYTPPSPPKPRKRRRGGFWRNVMVSTVAAAVCCAITGVVVSAYWQQRTNDLTASFDEKLNVLREEMEQNSHIGSGSSVSGTSDAVDGLTPAQVYARNADSVVAIISSNYNGASSGTGFVMTEDGYIVTNYHVVDGAMSVTVTCSDGTQYDAQVAGGDESNDIALLKVEATGLQAVTFGSSDVLIVGDRVAAIGNPLGELASTLTVGYISAKDRVVTTDGTQINMLQTDAAINSGNSGGPLFNMKGEVVGITTAKYSGTTASGTTIEGIGFAIPIDDVMGMLEDLRDYGYITGAYLGVSVSNVDSYDAELYGLPLGVLVHEVVSDSCAQKGGIKAKDIITNLGGYDIENLNDLTRALRKFEAGDTVTVTVSRGGNTVQLSLTLDEKPHS